MDHIQRELARVDADRRAHQWTEDDIERVLRDMSSPDEQVRVRALRSSKASLRAG